MTHEEYIQHKETIILDALEVIKKNGFECRLLNKQNGHIQAISKNGIILNFYPTTGTIAGYDYDSIQGLDCLLSLLREK